MNKFNVHYVLMACALWAGPTPQTHASAGQENSAPSQNADGQMPTDEELRARHPINTLLVQDPQAPDSTATLDELAAGVAAYEDQLTSLRDFLFECQVDEVERGVDSLYGHTSPGFRRMIARQDDAWLAMSTEFQDKFFVPYYAVWREGITLSQEMRHFSLVWGPGARFSAAQLYTLLMGVDIIRDMPGSDQLEKEKHRHSPLRSDFINRLTEYVVLPKQQKIDGAWCHVVQFDGFQTLWIDTNLGFVIRQRVYNWHENSSCERVIYQRDFKEIAPGLSFPFTIVDELCAQPLEVERPYWNQITSTSTHKILRFETEDIDPATFQIPIPEGSEVYDYVRQKQFIVSYGEEEPFKEALEFSRRMGERSWTTIGFGLGALGGLLLVAMFGRRAYLLLKGQRDAGGGTNA